MRRNDLNPNNLGDKGAIGRSTATKIRDGKIVTPNSLLQTDEMAGKGETGSLQRSHGAHPERTGQAQNGRVTSRLPGNGNFPR